MQVKILLRNVIVYNLAKRTVPTFRASTVDSEMAKEKLAMEI